MLLAPSNLLLVYCQGEPLYFFHIKIYSQIINKLSTTFFEESCFLFAYCEKDKYI